MKVLAIEKKTAAKGDEIDHNLLIREAQKAYELYSDHVIREIYFNDEHNAVIIMECETKGEAEAFLNELPLVKEGYISFDLMELHPYMGFSRLFDDSLIYE